MQPFYFFFLLFVVGRWGGIPGRVRALNLTVPLRSGRVGSDDLVYGPGLGFSFEPVQTSSDYWEATRPLSAAEAEPRDRGLAYWCYPHKTATPAVWEEAKSVYELG